MKNEELVSSEKVKYNVKLWKRSFYGIRLITIGSTFILLSLVLFIFTVFLSKEHYCLFYKVSLIIPVVMALIVIDGGIFRSYYEKRSGYAEPRIGIFKNRWMFIFLTILLVAVLVIKLSFADIIGHQISHLLNSLDVSYGFFTIFLIAFILFIGGMIGKNLPIIVGSLILGMLYVPLIFLPITGHYQNFTYALFAIGLALLASGIMWHKKYLGLCKASKDFEGEENDQE